MTVEQSTQLKNINTLFCEMQNSFVDLWKFSTYKKWIVILLYDN